MSHHRTTPLNPTLLSLMTTTLLLLPTPGRAVVIASYDVIDQQFNSANNGYTSPGRYDLFNGLTGTATPDGVDDVEVVVTSTGFTPSGGVTYTGSVDDSTTTGLVSSISSAGAPSINNNGHRSINTIDIRFLSSMTVTAENIADYSFSSGNTAGITWETAYLQYLDLNYQPIGATPVISSYLTHTPINGQFGNSYVADSKGTVLNVGTSAVSSGSSGNNDNTPTTLDTPVELGISPLTRIGGVRFVHMVEDTRGTTNGASGFTATINDLELRNFTVLPEPTTAVLWAMGGLIGFCRRRKGIG
jgi:MprA protease rhombosortase-interaction domain-containing protein